MITSGSNPDSLLERMASRLVESVQPAQSTIRGSISRLRSAKPGLSERALADHWAERICRRYAAEGALSALPAVVPGLGTSVQVALEGGAIATDLAYMLRCMARIVIGVGHVFGREIEQPFQEEFVKLLGLWCGASSLGKEAAIRVGSKVAVAQVKRLPSKVLGRVQRHLAKDLLTRVGVKRGPVMLGRLLPFGVGALVGGGFNYATMRSFKDIVVEFYASAVAVDQPPVPVT